MNEYMMVNIEPNKTAYFTSDTTWGLVPLSVDYFGNSSESIDSWQWTFGDGGQAYTQDATHDYTVPGRFDVTIQATTSGKATYAYTATKYITALADSMIGENVTGEPGQQVEVNIYAANTIPISGLRIPVDYSGTDYFDYANNVAAGSKKAVYLIYNTNESTPDLDPGSGPVLKLTFTIPSGATSDQSAQVSVEEFWTYVPQFFSDIIPNYTPRLVAGSVALPFDCGDINTDGAVNIFDATGIISYLYLEGDPPDPMKSADINGDCTVNIFDVTGLICFLYLDCTTLNCPGSWPCK
jgi:PKD repeat protein